MAKRSVKKKRGNDPHRGNDTILIFAGAGFLIILSLVLFVVTRDDAPERSVQPVMTLNPQISVNLTELPQATPLSGEAVEVWHALRAEVDACDAYSPERRAQMEQHIAWLIDPSDMPHDVILAMGDNPTERLIFGMAGYTSIQWRLDGRLPESCLVPIGLTLNEMLETLDSDPLTIYDEVGS